MTRDVDFDVVREEWCTYKTESGTIVKHRMSVEAIDFDDEAKQARPKWKSSYHIFPSKEDQGPPNENFVPGSLTDADIVGQVKFEALREPINVYDVPTENVLVLSKMWVTQIGRTEKFNKRGLRIFKGIIVANATTIPYPPSPARVVV